MNGFEAATSLIRSGSCGYVDGFEHLSRAARDLSWTRINPQALGEVDAAHEFATALADFACAHGDDLDHGARLAAGTAKDLADSARGYERLDTEHAVDFVRFEEAS